MVWNVLPTLTNIVGVGKVGRVGFNVPPNTLQVISGTIFTGQMTQPTVSSTEGQ